VAANAQELPSAINDGPLTSLWVRGITMGLLRVKCMVMSSGPEPPVERYFVDAHGADAEALADAYAWLLEFAVHRGRAAIAVPLVATIENLAAGLGAARAAALKKDRKVRDGGVVVEIVTGSHPSFAVVHCSSSGRLRTSSTRRTSSTYRQSVSFRGTDKRRRTGWRDIAQLTSAHDSRLVPSRLRE